MELVLIWATALLADLEPIDKSTLSLGLKLKT